MELRALMSSDVALCPLGPVGGRHRVWLWSALVAAVVVGLTIDEPVMAAARPLYHSDTAELVNNTIRYLGTGYLQVPLALLMLAAGAVYGPRVRVAGAWTLAAFLASGLVAHVLKLFIHRARPYVSGPAPEQWIGYVGNSDFASFPSAEAATSFAVAVTLAAWYPRVRLPVIILALLVSLARVPVGAHHPSDIAAGALLGVAIAQCLISVATCRARNHAAAS